MKRSRDSGARSPRPLWGLTATVLLVAGLLPAATVAQVSDAPPTLTISKAEPLPESLREPVPDSLDDLRAIQDRVQSLVEELRAVTVGVRRGPAQGTGVIVSRSGYVLTAAHVSGPPGRAVTLIMPDGATLDGVSLGRNEVVDAGLVRITERGTWPVAKIGDYRSVKAGDWVVGTGHPGGFDTERQPVLRLGRVILKMSALLQSDAALVGGDSGGPLFDLNGRVIAIHSRIGPGTEYNFHVPVSFYVENWHWLTQSEERPIEPGPGGPMLGVDGKGVKGGCRVTRITERSPADEAGLKVGDLIVRLDRRYILGLEDLVSGVNQYAPGDVIEIAYQRDGERKTVRATLAERPQRPRQPRSE